MSVSSRTKRSIRLFSTLAAIERFSESCAYFCSYAADNVRIEAISWRSGRRCAMASHIEAMCASSIRRKLISRSLAYVAPSASRANAGSGAGADSGVFAGAGAGTGTGAGGAAVAGAGGAAVADADAGMSLSDAGAGTSLSAAYAETSLSSTSSL